MSAMRVATAASLITGECPVWAVSDDQIILVRPDRGDAANGRFEPFLINAARCTNDG